MARPTCLLGIDIGGTAVKVCLFDLEGQMLARHEASIPVATPRPGWAEIDAEDWFAAIVAGVGSVKAQAGVSSADVAAIGLSNMIGTVTALDAEGTPLRPAIAYYDTRSTAEAEWLLERAPDIPRVTGNRVISGNTSLASILWVQRHEPQVAQRATAFAQTNTLIHHWLTGQLRVDFDQRQLHGTVRLPNADLVGRAGQQNRF